MFTGILLFQVELSLTLEAILNASCINTLKRWRKGLSSLRRAFVKCFEGGANRRSKVDQEPNKKTASNKTKNEIENGNSKKDDEDAEDDEERAREAEEEAKEALRKVT